ncbi:MAG: hypothetical protein M3O30_13905 [Planctomycetota bacterium]|nr:hypothetical protein [Planctomycetota bacterium]
MSEPVQSGIALPRRTLGRGGTAVPIIIWTIGAGMRAADGGIVSAAIVAGADWFFIPAAVDIENLPEFKSILPQSASLILGVDGTEISSRRITLAQRLKSLGRPSCAAVMLQNVTADEVKSGVPFHRLLQLRDSGLFPAIWIEAQTAPQAQWLIEHSPAPAVCVPFSVEDQSIKYHTTTSSLEMDTALIAASPVAPGPQDISFILSEPAVVSVMVPFPKSLRELSVIIFAAGYPMESAARESLWEKYTSSHPAPASRGRHSFFADETA